MDFEAKYYRTHPLSMILKLESVVDRRGNMFYCVTMASGTKENIHYMFQHLTSALDFINSNFK